MSSPLAPSGLHSIYGRLLQIGKSGSNHVYQEGRMLHPAANNPMARHVFKDDFDGEGLNAFYWDGEIGTSTAAVLPTVTTAIGGKVRLTTGLSTNGTLATNGCQLHSDLNWQSGNGSLVFEARVKMDAITSVRVVVGLTDQVAALESPFESTGGSDTLSSTATDAVAFVFDTAMTTDDWWCAGNKAGTVATSVDTGIAPAADTFQKFRIEVDSSGTAEFFLNGARKGRIANCITSTAPLTPVINATGLTSAARLIDVDYIYVAQDR